ncbi:hypothetical protein ACLOJK_035505 [Asimina triloba]
MPSSSHQIDVKMSGFAATSQPVDAEPEAFIIISMRKQFRRLRISSEGILCGVGTTDLDGVEGRFRCPLRFLERPQLSNPCYREMVLYFNVDPQIHDRLTADMVIKGCEIVGRALEDGVRTLVISADVQVLETTFFGYEEEEAAWAVRESLDLAGRPASRRSIQSLRRCKYGRRYLGQSTCTICLDEFALGSSIVQMPCSHVFHDHCITRWLQRSHVCPLCRFALSA